MRYICLSFDNCLSCPNLPAGWIFVCVFFCRVSLSPECQKMVQLHELGLKWETNYLRYICVITMFKIPLNRFSVLQKPIDLQKQRWQKVQELITSCISAFIVCDTEYVQQDKTVTRFLPVLPGKRGRATGSRAPHGGGGLTELRNVGDHDGAARADGRAWEPHHYYTPETRGWLLPSGEEVRWPSIQPGAWIHYR